MTSKLSSDSFDIKKALEEEGVYAYGFGHIAKAAMFDRDLSCVAKGIYAYFCSFTNARNTAYPKLSTILNDLNIDKKTYYKHFEQLVVNGYITVKKSEKYKKKNVYIINEYVKKVNCELAEDEESESVLIVDGIKAHGYGTVPKLAMIDKRLTIKAKALMAFLLSLTGAGKRAFPRRDAICMKLAVNKNTYTSMMNELIRYGYIKVTQRRTRHGNFSINDYHFEVNPVEIEELIVLESSDVDNSAIVENNVESCGKENSALQKNEISTSFNNAKNGLNSGFSPCPKNSPLFKNGLNSGFSPCPKNSPLFEDHRVPKIPPLPCPKNSPPNINSNNITTIQSTSIHHPSNKVIDYNLPKGKELIDTVHSISHYEEYEKYSDMYSHKHCKVVELLVNIFSSDHIIHKTERYAASFLWRRFVFILNNKYGDYSPCNDFIFDIINYYEECISMYNIEYPIKYLRTLIIDKIFSDYDDCIFPSSY